MSRLEIAANVATVMLCVLVTGDLVVRRAARRGASVAQDPRSIQVYRLGESVPVIPGVDLERASRTLLVVVSSTCRYCRESVGFYRSLTSSIQGARASVQTVGVCLDELPACKAYLEQEQVRLDQVVGLGTGGFRVRGTPTLLLVGRTRVLLGLWSGKLTKQTEREVAKLLLEEPAAGM